MRRLGLERDGIQNGPGSSPSIDCLYNTRPVCRKYVFMGRGHVEAGYESSILVHDVVVMALHLLVMRGMHWTWTLALAQCTLVMQIAKPNKWFIGEIDKLIYSFNKTKGIHIASKCNE